jgi:F-type H+-transporting ATPase subunit b
MTRRLPLARSAAAGAAVLLLPGQALAAGDGGGLGALLYQALNLAIVLGILFYFGRKPVLEYFATRRSDIKRDLDTAAELLATAESRNSEIQRKLADLQGEIEESRETSRRRADEECERILAEARKAAERIRADAHAAAEQELTRAREALRAEAADLAIKLAAELLDQNVGEGDRERLLDEFITRIESGPGATA